MDDEEKLTSIWIKMQGQGHMGVAEMKTILALLLVSILMGCAYPASYYKTDGASKPRHSQGRHK